VARTAEVVVVGGGVIGTAIAYYLSRRGVPVLLIEREGLASGTSGACDGFAFLQTKRPGVHLRLARESLRLYGELAEVLPRSIEFRRHGGLVLLENEREHRGAEAHLRMVSDELGTRMLDRSEVHALEPQLGEHILGAMYCPMDAQVNPISLTLAFAQAATERGAEFMLGTNVLGIRRNGSTWTVVASTGEVESPCVVIAAGVWSQDIVASTGLSLPVRPRRGQILVTEPAPRTIGRAMISGGYLAVKFDAEVALRGEDPRSRLGFGLTVEQTEAGSFLLGSTREFAGMDRRVSEEATRVIAEAAIRTIPALERMCVIRAFVGLRPWTPDGMPFLGEVEGKEGLFVAAGHEGDGIALAPVTGYAITELIVNGRCSVDLASFCPTRPLVPTMG